MIYLIGSVVFSTNLFENMNASIFKCIRLIMNAEYVCVCMCVCACAQLCLIFSCICVGICIHA